MKVLWVVNKPLPAVSEAMGKQKELSQSWLLDLYRAVCDTDISLSCACVDRVKSMQTVCVDGVTHYVMPLFSKFIPCNAYKKFWDEIMEKEKPDIIHVHGTEYMHPLPLLKAYPHVPSVLTVQGVMTRISEAFYGGLTLKEVLKYRTLRENMRLAGMFFTKRIYKKRAKDEQEMVRRVDCITGRTLWDYSVLKEINPRLKYHKCNYNLRNNFYEAKKWSLEGIQRHSIYTAFSSYPLKGLHQLLKAVAIVKKQYPDVMVKVPGMPGMPDGSIKVNSGYAKYIKALIEKEGIRENVCFLGGQSAQAVEQNMQKAHLCVVSSAIEGASATLREAMHIGTPCICSYRGGMTELLEDGKDGFYYDYNEYGYLAERIMQIFAQDALAMQFSEKLIQKAEAMHDRQKNFADWIAVYEDVLSTK